MYRIFEETTAVLRHVTNQGGLVDRRKQDILSAMAYKMDATLQLMQEQQRNFYQLAMMADEMCDMRLADTYHEMARMMNRDIQAAEDVLRQLKNIANN